MKKEQTNEWIPVTEEMPDDFERVLLWIRWNVNETKGYIYGIGYHCEDIWYGDGALPHREVLAWMPLPEPYKGETA